MTIKRKWRNSWIVFLIWCTSLIIFSLPALAIDPDSFEDDDTFSQANVIVLNDESQRHNFHDAGDKDWVQFYGIAQEIYEIKVSNAGTNCNAVIELYDTDGTTLLKGPWNWGFEGDDELMSWRCTQEGIYYVMVGNYDSEVFGENTGYDLSVYIPTSSSTGSIVGTVTDAYSGDPIEGAQIITDKNYSAITLADGSYSMVHPVGTYTLTASATGYESKNYSGVVVPEGETVTQDFKMDSTASKEKSDDGDSIEINCFIATAAYGSPMEPKVKALREFRDRFLITNTVGKTFVCLYYTYSPPIADFIAKHDILRAMVRVSLLPFVGMSWIAINIGPVSTLAFMLLFGPGLIGLAGLRRKFKK